MDRKTRLHQISFKNGKQLHAIHSEVGLINVALVNIPIGTDELHLPREFVGTLQYNT